VNEYNLEKGFRAIGTASNLVACRLRQQQQQPSTGKPRTRWTWKQYTPLMKRMVPVPTAHNFLKKGSFPPSSHAENANGVVFVGSCLRRRGTAVRAWSSHTTVFHRPILNYSPMGRVSTRKRQNGQTAPHLLERQRLCHPLGRGGLLLGWPTGENPMFPPLDSPTLTGTVELGLASSMRQSPPRRPPCVPHRPRCFSKSPLF
jgi:hypothetical protein